MFLQESHRVLLRSHGIVVARVLLGALFLLSGIQILLGGMTGINGVAGMIAGTGLPMATVLAIIVVLIKVVGGAALIVGYRTDMAAAALFLFTAAATLAFHMSSSDMGIFGWDMGLFKNLSIMGGLIYAMAFGPGQGWSLDRKAAAPMPSTGGF